MIWLLSILPQVIADPLREFLTRGAKRALPTVDEREREFSLEEREKARGIKEKAAEIIKENLK